MLGVTIDALLLAGAAVVLAPRRMFLAGRSVRATPDERTRRLPGDELIREPLASLTHAVTIRRTPDEVWPWLAQMGAGSRAGWYSYDTLDSGGQPSARRIVPELQHLSVGMIFPAMPAATDAFTLLGFEPARTLILGVRAQGAEPLVTWTFVLTDDGPGATRLLVRVRGGAGYQFHGLPRWLTTRVVPLVHLVMQRRQLLGIATRAEQADGLLDQVMPRYDVVERHHVTIAAPPRVVFDTACAMNIRQPWLIRAIFRARELILRTTPDDHRFVGALLPDMQSIGWRVLAEQPGREVVVGAVTRPWEANVRFRSLTRDEFVRFAEPDYVKIVWTLRADPAEGGGAVFRTETRVVATDAGARLKFRRYWRMFSPGIKAIRLLMLAPLKAEAQRRAASPAGVST